ncbi:MAG: lysophospholipid acyltransferase family protein [Nitrospirae bacterium]|nr:lysophospholipid acyltransferase family protein [Nitrospirota bacterium]
MRTGDKKTTWARKLGWAVEYMAAMAGVGVFHLMPFTWAVRLGGLLGSLWYYVDQRHRTVTLDNLKLAFTGKSPEELEKIAKRAYRNLGYSAAEFIRSNRYGEHPIEAYVEFVNYDSFVRAHAKGKGVLFVTGHFGSWELMAMAHAYSGNPSSAVVRPLDNPYLDRMVTRLRTRCGNSMINKSRGMREILRALDKGRGVGILLDQNVAKREGVFVDFFGRPACTNKGLAIIARKTQAPVVPTFIVRKSLTRHKYVFGDEIPLIDTGDKDADILENTQAYTRAIEDMVRKHPDHWFWMHRRWKTRPDDERERYTAR